MSTNKVVSDDYINELFEGTKFGDTIDNSVIERRKLIKKTLRNQLDGYWSGHTAYGIIVHGGFLLDTKVGRPKFLTALGEAFLKDRRVDTDLEEVIRSADQVRQGMYDDKCDEVVDLKKIISQIYAIAGEFEDVAKLCNEGLKA